MTRKYRKTSSICRKQGEVNTVSGAYHSGRLVAKMAAPLEGRVWLSSPPGGAGLEGPSCSVI